MKKKVISVICIFLTPLIFFASCQKNGLEENISPSQIVTAFYQACKSGSYDIAKNYLSASSLDYFDKQGKENPDKSLQAFMEYCNNNLSVPELTNVLVQSEKISDSNASVDTAFVYQEMEPNFVPHFLVKNDKSWQIDMASTLEQLSKELPQETSQKELSDNGYWLKHPNYGNVWRPKEVGYNWQPYCSDGKFSSTKEGWLWESDRDWGKRVFNYGRWAQAGPWGWVWVPDDSYAPSWVAWRANDEYVGWSPLPPGVNPNNKAKPFTPPSNTWVFLPTRDFVQMVNSTDKTNYSKSRKPIKESSKLVSNSTYYGTVESFEGQRVNNGLSTDFLEERSGVKIVRRIISAPVKVAEDVLYNDNDENYGRGRKGIPPGHGGIPPGQAKKLEKQYERYERKEERRERKEERREYKEERKDKYLDKLEKREAKEERKQGKHKGKGHGDD